MSFQLETVSTGGAYFKPADYLNAAAVLFEPKSIDFQKPSPFGPRDSVVANITVFHSQKELDEGKPSEISNGIRVENAAITRDLQSAIGKALIAKIGQSDPKPGKRPAWILKPVNQDTIKKVGAYGEAREAALNEALADAPSFD